jgi:hypothetical protein
LEPFLVVKALELRAPAKSADEESVLVARGDAVSVDVDVDDEEPAASSDFFR